MNKTESKEKTIVLSKTEQTKIAMRPPLKRVLVNITIEINTPYMDGKFIKIETPRILREFADIEESSLGGRDRVETYFDKHGNKLTNIVALDYGSQIPYPESLEYEDRL